MASLLPINTISAPELRSPKGEAIVKFRLSYDKYMRQVDVVNAGLLGNRRVQAIEMKACIASELLESLVLFNTFEGRETVEQVTEDDMRQWIDARSRCSAATRAKQVKDALIRVKFIPDAGDPDGASLKFFTDVVTEIRRNRSVEIMQSAPKAFVEQLIRKLEPAQVRETVEASYEFWTDEEKGSINFFREEVTRISVEWAKFRTMAQKNKPAKVKSQAGPSSQIEPSLEGGKKSAKRSWSQKCLNPKCDEIHPLYKCPISSEKEKDELLSKYRESKKSRKGSSRSLSVPRRKDIMRLTYRAE